MKTDVWNRLYRIVQDLAQSRPRGSRRIPDRLIVLTHLWSAVNDRPTSWATERAHWPLWCQRLITSVPTSTTMSRRLKSSTVLEFLGSVLREAQADLPVTLWRMVDGKPLPIGGGSGDKQAGYGRAVGGKAKGYKLHVLLDSSGKILGWRIAPMNVPEQRMAARLLRDADGEGYCVADGNFDSNELCGRARTTRVQMVTPRRRRGGLGRRRQDPARLRSVQMTEGPSDFGRELLDQRDAIERHFANLTNFGGGLGPLPAWVRTWRRVQRWVAAKLAIYAVKELLRREAQAA